MLHNHIIDHEQLFLSLIFHEHIQVGSYYLSPGI